MDKVKLKLTRAELNALRDHVTGLCDTHTPEALRHMESNKGFVFFALRMRASLFLRLLVRLNLASVMYKDYYNVSLPVEECFALLSEWTQLGNQRLGLVRTTLGKIDQALS
jgi:hypothetical protein